MRNLKKILALVLALVMSMSLVSVASADFSDAAEINHDEAVNILYALGVVDGVGNNTFNPKGTVTRAQMAKMITIITLGNVDVTAFKGTATDLKDIEGHWAEAYIKYCYSQGIISGKGNGIFAPNANVTTAEAAKMLLVAIGYNAKVQGYTGVGDQWSINVTRDAQLSKFYKDLVVASDADLTREQAAQMIWNAVQADLIVKTSMVNRVDGTITDSYTPDNTKDLLGETFGAAIKYGYLAGVSYDSVKKVYNTSIDNNGTLGTAVPTIDDGFAADTTLYPAANYSNLFGQKVAVVYKDAKTVYGIYGAANVLAEGTVGSITDENGAAVAHDDTKIKLGGTKITLNSTDYDVLPVYVSNVATDINSANDATVTLSATAYSNVAAIDNNDDNKVDLFVVYPTTVAKVTYIGTASITAGGNSYAWDKENSVYTYGGDNYTFAEGVAKNDYVLIPGYEVSGLTKELTEVEKITGKVEATSTGKAQINGTWYKTNGQTAALGSTYNAWIVDEYLVATSVVSSASKDLLYVINHENGNTMDKGRVDALFADGTRAVIEINKIGSTTITNGNISALTNDTLYTYVKNSDGTYNVTDLSSTNKAGYSSFAATANNYVAATSTTNATLGGNLIADDAVIFLKTGTSTYKYTVIDGKTLKTYASQTSTGEALLGSANGLSSVKAATMVVSSAFGVETVYGYITSTPYLTKESSVTYANYTVWTPNGELTVKDTRTGAAKKDIITLTSNSNGTMTSAVVATSGNNTTVVAPVAITGFNSADRTITLAAADGSFLTTNNKYATTVKFMYMNTKDTVGMEGGEIALAEKLGNGAYNMNAYAVYGTNGSGNFSSLKAIIFDVNNDIDGVGTAGYAVSGKAAAADGNNGVTVEVTVDRTSALDGETVTFTVKLSGSATGTATSAGITFSGIDALAAADLDGATPVAGSNIANATIYNGKVYFTPAAAGTVNATYTITGTVNASAVSVS